MDDFPFQSAASPFCGLETTADGLWTGMGDADASSGLLGSLESGGALLNSSSWTISTEPGEGLRWNGVKNELLYDVGGVKGQTEAFQASSGLLCAAPKGKPAPTGFLGVKSDPDGPWVASVAPVIGTSAASRAGVSRAELGAISPPGFPLPSESAVTTAASSTKKAAPTSRSTTARSTSSSSPAPQRSSQRAAAAAGRRARSSAAIEVAAAAVTPPTLAPKLKLEEEGEMEDEDDEDDDGHRDGDSDDQEPGLELSDKRRRNREHAKRSRMRKRVRLGGLEGMVLSLRRENVRLRQIVKKGIPERAADIIRTCASDNTNADSVAKQDVVQGMRPAMSVSSSSRWSSRVGGGGSRTRLKLEGGLRHAGGHGGGGVSKDRRVPSALKLMSPCYQSVKALAESQANFILTNPNLPDCPIVFASQGFLELTGYEASKVVGKNCRFLQGPATDASTVSIVRNNVAAGRDTSVCILNYKADGTPFWNQLSIGVLLDAHGQVANHVGVLCEVNQMPPAVFHRLLHRVPLPASLLNDESSDSGEDVAKAKSTAGSIHGGARSAKPNSSSGTAAVDRLRRTRAATAAATGAPP